MQVRAAQDWVAQEVGYRPASISHCAESRLDKVLSYYIFIFKSPPQAILLSFAGSTTHDPSANKSDSLCGMAAYTRSRLRTDGLPFLLWHPDLDASHESKSLAGLSCPMS